MKKQTYAKRICAALLSLLVLAGIGGTAFVAKAASANETAIYNFLKSEMGLNTAAACGVLANIYNESGFDPHCYGDGGTSYGICQWHAERFSRLRNYCSNYGYDYTTLNGQLHYLDYELRTSYPSVYSKLHNVSNDAQGAYDAAYYWCYYYEVPYGYNTGVSDRRGSLAAYTYWPVYSAKAEVPVTTQPSNGGTTTPINPDTSFNGVPGTGSATTLFARFIQMLRTIIGALQYMLT